MLAERVRASLRTNQLVVVIGARGTGKTHCADELEQYWSELGVRVLRLDAGTADQTQDLERPLAEALGCDPNSLDSHSLASDDTLRIIVDRCDHLYDREWFTALQERWRALLLDRQSQERLAAVLLGRPLFRQVAGGASSPLLNAGPVLTTTRFDPERIQAVFDVDPECANKVYRRTGGHPALTRSLLEEIDGDATKMDGAIDSFVESHRHYFFHLIQDHPPEARGVLGDLLESPEPVQQGALIQRHFGSAHAAGVEAFDDLQASGLIERRDDGACRIGATVLRDINGLRGIVRGSTIVVPSYSHEVMGEAWRVVFDAENRLRRLVIDNLGEIDPAWWITRVSPEMRGRAEGRRKEEAAVLAMEDAQFHPVVYLNLSELFDLVFEQRNWSRSFRAVFRVGERGVSEASAQFVRLRNRLAHNRPLSEDQLEELRRALWRLGLADSQPGPASGEAEAVAAEAET